MFELYFSEDLSQEEKIQEYVKKYEFWNAQIKVEGVQTARNFEQISKDTS